MFDFLKKHVVGAVLAFDAVALAVFWYLLPEFKRPFEGLMAVLMALSLVTVVAARRRKWLPTVALCVGSVAFSVFAVEMAEKFFKITDVFETGRQVAPTAGARKYQWSYLEPATYLAAKEQALRDGVNPAVFNTDFGGDVFARENLPKLRVRTHKRGDKVDTLEAASEDSTWLQEPPLGSELRPNNVFRQFCFDEASQTMMYDGVCHTGPYGFRTTRGNDKSDEVYVFMGCSFTFGSYLNDDQTLPHYFSEKFGFGKRVINLAIGGNGPHHSLRDLELDHRLGKAGVKPGQVKAVVYAYLDEHAGRIVKPTPAESPRYALEDGRLVLRGTFSDAEDLSRLDILIMRGRVYPKLAAKFSDKEEVGGVRDYELAYAIFAEMNRICEERYGIPLTVVYWNREPETIRRLEATGVRLIKVSDAFEENWETVDIKYKLFDTHPNPYANRLLAGHVFRILTKE